jgi:Domain of unknown function (DUF4129)
VSARRAAAAGVLLLALVAPAPAAAEEVTAAELRALAARAADDPAALERLKRVDAVDGRAIDIAGSLRGAAGDDLRARLELLAAGGARGRDAAAAREEAQRILSERRFRGTRIEGPFRGPLDRLGDMIRSIRDLVPRLDGTLPGGRAVVWIVLVAAFGGLAWLIAGRTVRRRAAMAAAAAARAPGTRAETPAALERRADEAERRGDHEEALRLRFRAGLLRLDARGAIAFRPSLQTGEVARALRSDAFDRLAADFDDIVYGARPATADDVATARREWDRVLEAAR